MLDKIKWICLLWGRYNKMAVSAPSGGFFIANISFPEVPTNREAWAAAILAVADSRGFLFVGAIRETAKIKWR